MTTCVENLTCIPHFSPLEVFHAFDATYGTGMSIVVMALILGVIEVAIYMRTRSLGMLAVVGIYTLGTFGAMLTNTILQSQYHIAVYVIALAGTTVAAMAIRKISE